MYRGTRSNPMTTPTHSVIKKWKDCEDAPRHRTGVIFQTKQHSAQTPVSASSSTRQKKSPSVFGWGFHDQSVKRRSKTLNHCTHDNQTAQWRRNTVARAVLIHRFDFKTGSCQGVLQLRQWRRSADHGARRHELNPNTVNARYGG